MDSKKFIKEAKSAVENGKKTEALGLYKQGIKIILEEIKDKKLTEDERSKLKQDCSEYLSTAEELQKEISDDAGQTEGTQSSSDEDIDKYVDALIERQTDSAVTLSDVCGCHHAKEQLKECVVIPLKFPQLFQGARPRPWKGILLYGAPGTGKTMLGRAIAGEYPEISFIRVPASDFISRYIKEPDKMIRQLFIKVKNQKSQLDILFIDDLEVLFLKDQYQCENVRRVATELLCQIDGCENVLILTATNEPWIIPHHFLKRFNRRLHIPLPDKETRTQLLIKFFETVKHEITDDDFKTIADQLEQEVN